MLVVIGTNCTGIYNSNEPTCLWTYSSILWRSKKYQFYNLWYSVSKTPTMSIDTMSPGSIAIPPRYGFTLGFSLTC
jgi:hypothetical protein